MSSERKLKWLKVILLVKVFFCFFVWGLPYLLAPMAYFQRLGVPVPERFALHQAIRSHYHRLRGRVLVCL